MHLLGDEHIANIMNMLPFMDIASVSDGVLKSVHSRLRTELATLRHSIEYSHGQYKLANNQLTELEQEQGARAERAGHMALDEAPSTSSQA
jgi:hypothetical protein